MKYIDAERLNAEIDRLYVWKPQKECIKQSRYEGT
jgi:hypothetical protein